MKHLFVRTWILVLLHNLVEDYNRLPQYRKILYISHLTI